MPYSRVMAHTFSLVAVCAVHRDCLENVCSWANALQSGYGPHIFIGGGVRSSSRLPGNAGRARGPAPTDLLTFSNKQIKSLIAKASLDSLFVKKILKIAGFSWPTIFFSCRLLQSLSHSFGLLCTTLDAPALPTPQAPLLRGLGGIGVEDIREQTSFHFFKANALSGNGSGRMPALLWVRRSLTQNSKRKALQLASEWNVIVRRLVIGTNDFRLARKFRRAFLPVNPALDLLERIPF
jgi:hypothetical protein